MRLPQQASSMNSIQRNAKLTLDSTGLLKGEVEELRLGDRAWAERQAQLAMTRKEDRIKPIESILSGSLSSFRITKASIVHLRETAQPFGFNYSFEAVDIASARVRLKAGGFFRHEGDPPVSC
jgi:hypothetical protein